MVAMVDKVAVPERFLEVLTGFRLKATSTILLALAGAGTCAGGDRPVRVGLCLMVNAARDSCLLLLRGHISALTSFS